LITSCVRSTGVRSEKVNPDQMQLLLQGLHTPGPGGKRIQPGGS
jgi:hypothetical protein